MGANYVHAAADVSVEYAFNAYGTYVDILCDVCYDYEYLAVNTRVSVILKNVEHCMFSE